MVDAFGIIEWEPKLSFGKEVLDLWTGLGLELGERTWFFIVLTRIMNLVHYLELSYSRSSNALLGWIFTFFF